MFAQSAALSSAYIALTVAPTKEACKAVMKQAGAVIQGCKKAKEDVYTNGPKVHGARQHSQLDMLDIWQNKAEAVFDNAEKMMVQALN